MIEARAAAIGKRVLIVEDDYFIAKGLARSLETAGADVIGPNATVADALELIGAERLDGAVLDIKLRGGLVFPVADVLAERGVPFIFVTGYSSGAIPARYDRIPRFEKPVEPQTFIQRMFDRPA